VVTLDRAPAADALYDVAPADFVAARNALAKELRAAGDKEQAAVVAKLRRPTPLAYALNHVARHRPASLAAALEAGAALETATAAAVAGDAGELRTATAADRDAMRALTDDVAKVLDARAADLAQKVTATIRAAVADPDVAAEVEAGRLTAEHESSGFGLGLGDTATATDAPAASPPRDDLAPRREAKRAKVDQAAKERAQRAAEERRARQRRDAEHRRLLAKLEARARRLVDEATAAEAAAAEARTAATAAEDELERARQEGGAP
jgi:hypothetical protein